MRLSPNEAKTLDGFCDGLLGPEIAARYGWRENYPQTYAHRAKRKLRCRTRSQMIAKYTRLKLSGML